jgi:uncharacterized protein (DUF952 family)
MAAAEHVNPALAAEGVGQGDGVLPCATRNVQYAMDMVLLVIDPDRLTSELKWEPPAHPKLERATTVGSKLFPHVYGPLNMEAVAITDHGNIFGAVEFFTAFFSASSIT